MRRKTFCGRLLAAILVLCLLPVMLAGCSAKNRNEVRVFQYGDYIDPELIEQFEEETGITVVMDTFDTNEEMYPVIKNRAGVYDVICSSDYMIERLRTDGLLQELDFSKIPESKNIGSQYYAIADQNFDPGNKYAVPYQVGVAGIMYNEKKLGKDAIDSWDDLWDPKYKGSIIMQDSLRDTLMVGLKKHGHSLNSTNEEDLKEAVDDLIAQKPLVYKYANDSARDFMIGNTADVGVLWNGEMLYSQELNEDLAFTIPKEGTEIFIDAFVVPKNALHPDNAMKWIDFTCRADVAYTNFEYLTYTTPNEAAKAMMDEELQENRMLFPTEEDLKNSEVLRDLGPEADSLFSKYWKIFKSAS